MKIRVGLIPFSLALGSCAFAAPEEAYEVEEVLADIKSEQSKLDGETVAIHGWLGECGGLDCGIYPSIKDARTVQLRDPGTEAWSDAMGRRLSVGAGDGFDNTAYWMQFDEVVIYGEINASWNKPPNESGTSYACFDRCDDIRPESIKKILF